MHRLSAMTVILFLAASLPVWAQHGGGHGSMGGHSGFSARGSLGGHSASPGAFAGTHSSFASRPGRGRSFNSANSVRSMHARNFNHSNNLRIRTFGFRNNCFGRRCGFGYPWLGYGIDPYWWWDSGSSYDQSQQDQIGLANEMNAQSLEQQRMREQGDPDVYARSTPPPPRPEQTDPAPATVLVFRDQHKEEIQNYAIVGQTLWNFSPQHTEKIPLSNLDLPATTKVNDDRGVSFHLPGANEGQ